MLKVGFMNCVARALLPAKSNHDPSTHPLIRSERRANSDDDSITTAPRNAYFAAFPRFRSVTHFGSPLRADFGGFPARKLAQRISRAGSSPVTAIFTAISATAFTIQSKFSCPTDVISASGAGFRKSIAYGTPPSTANSTVFESYPSTWHNVSASFSIRSFKAGEEGGGFPFTYRS